MHSPYSLSLLSIRQIPFYRLHFRSTSELPEADSVQAIQRRIPEFRLHPRYLGYSFFLRSHGPPPYRFCSAYKPILALL